MTFAERTKLREALKNLPKVHYEYLKSCEEAMRIYKDESVGYQINQTRGEIIGYLDCLTRMHVVKGEEAVLLRKYFEA